MKVVLADSFHKSLKRLIWHESHLYKSYSLFRYDIPHFFSNVWRFKKVLWNHQWWDYRYTLEALQTSLSIMEKGMHKGMEIRETREKKILKMQRSIEILKNISEDNYMERAEEVLGKLPHRDLEFEDSGNGTSTLVDNDTPEEKVQWRKVYDYSNELEESEWEELWEIFKGKKHSDYEEYLKIHPAEFTQDEIDDGKAYQTWYSGDNMKSWWD